MCVCVCVCVCVRAHASVCVLSEENQAREKEQYMQKLFEGNMLDTILVSAV